MAPATRLLAHAFLVLARLSGMLDHMLEPLIREGENDRHRPWQQRTTGGVLVAVVLLILAAQVLLDLLLR